MTSRIAMSKASKGLQVTVSVQLRHEDDAVSEPVQPFLQALSGDGDEALEAVLEILQQALPRALAQADSDLRAALLEHRFSQMIDQPQVHSSGENSQATTETQEATNAKE